MLKMDEKCTLYIPEERKSAITPLVKEKLSFLSQHVSVKKSIIGLPDFGDDGLGLNGLYFESEGVVFPMGPGKDVGCGFRLLHVKAEDMDTKRLEKSRCTFAETIASPAPGLRLSLEDISSILTKPFSWLQNRGIEDPFLQTYQDFDIERPSFLNKQQIKRSIARIAKGNHFIEIRQLTHIDESIAPKLNMKSGDYLIHIHSGSGVFIEKSFLRYVSLMRRSDKNLQNGYESFGELTEDWTKNYLSDVQRSLRLACANRSLLAQVIGAWLNAPFTTILDTPHDTIHIEGERVHHYKAVQQYSSYKGVELAIIPSTISDSSFVVQKTGDFPFINHGLGDGDTGEEKPVKDVLTNFTEPIKRKFFHAKPVFDIAEKLGWYKTVMNAKPWICIKNRGHW